MASASFIGTHLQELHGGFGFGKKPAPPKKVSKSVILDRPLWYPGAKAQTKEKTMLSPSLCCPPNPWFPSIQPNPSLFPTSHRLHALTQSDAACSPMPNHVAVVMDGNRRWARARGLTPDAGYLAGARSLKLFVDLCCKWGIQFVSVFAFSSDNWLRPKAEVDFLMGLLESSLKDEIAYMLREDIKLSVIGDSSNLPKSVKDLITYAEHTTKNNSRLNLVIAINYSGKYDIVQACQSIAQKVKDGLMDPQEVNEFMIENELVTQPHPPPDLLIRTSGEIRLSNFFLWQVAYTELYFTQSLWPDFGEDQLLQAVEAFQQRQRRYGG